MGFTFNEAVKELTGIDITNDTELLQSEITRNTAQGVKNISSPKPFSIDDLTLEKDMRRTVAYLNKIRHIDTVIIQKLIEKNLLYQQAAEYKIKENKAITAHNIVFPI